MAGPSGRGSRARGTSTCSGPHLIASLSLIQNLHFFFFCFCSLSQTSLFSNSSPSCHHSHHSPSTHYFQASLTHRKLMFAEPATFTSGSSEETPPRLRVLKWELSDELASTPTPPPPQPHFT